MLTGWSVLNASAAVVGWCYAGRAGGTSIKPERKTEKHDSFSVGHEDGSPGGIEGGRVLLLLVVEVEVEGGD